MGNENGFTMQFEKSLIELEKKIEEIRVFSSEKNIDMSEEIQRLQAKADVLKERIYRNLTPLQKVQVARHPKRPTFLEYVELIFDDFIELHGDRLFKDDPALVGGLASLNGIPVTVLGQQKGGIPRRILPETSVVRIRRDTEKPCA